MPSLSFATRQSTGSRGNCVRRHWMGIGRSRRAAESDAAGTSRRLPARRHRVQARGCIRRSARLPRRQRRRRRRSGSAQRQVPERGDRPSAANGHHQRLSDRRHAGVQVRPGRADGPGRLSAQHEHVRPRLDEGRRCGARPDGVRRQGRVPELPPRQQQRQPQGARPERHRRDSQRRARSSDRCAIPTARCCRSIARSASSRATAK